MSQPKRICQSHERGEIVVGFRALDADLALGLGRVRRADKAFHAAMRRFSDARWDGDAGSYRVVPSDPLEELLIGLDRKLSGILEAPLTPRMVNATLEISSQERIRWAKDGRLTVAGNVRSRRGGQQYSVPVFAVAPILEILREGSTISRWRETDRLALFADRRDLHPFEALRPRPSATKDVKT
jgi:hypothetical protein